MKKILIITFLFICACTKTINVDNQTNIENNTILFIKTSKSTSLLIYSDNETTLLELDNKEKIYTKENNIKINNLILRENIITDIDYNNKYILNKNINLKNLKINITDKILIELNNYKLCIYDKNINKNGNFNNCNFIYILNNEEEVYIKLNENTKALFYNEYKTFSKKFLEHIYITWIDTYIINTNETTKLKLDKEYIIENINV